MRKFTVALALIASFLFAQSAAAVNLVVNGGFETGNFSGWTLSGDMANWFHVYPTNPHTGTYALQDGTLALGYISQALSTTPGQAYELSFWVSNPGNADGYKPNEVLVQWAGKNLSDQVDIPKQPYTEYRFNVLASSSSTVLTLGLDDNPAYLYLDDISVNAVPVPGSLVLLGSGLLALLGCRRLKRS